MTESTTRETAAMDGALADLTHLDGRPAGRVYRAPQRIVITLALALVVAAVVGLIAGLSAALGIAVFTWIAL